MIRPKYLVDTIANVSLWGGELYSRFLSIFYCSFSSYEANKKMNDLANYNHHYEYYLIHVFTIAHVYNL